MSYRIGICRGGECLKSQTVHSENRGFVFGLVKGYGLFLYRLDFSYFAWTSKRVRVAAALRSDSGKPCK